MIINYFDKTPFIPSEYEIFFLKALLNLIVVYKGAVLHYDGGRFPGGLPSQPARPLCAHAWSLRA